MNLFISHSVEDRTLAELWKQLLATYHPGADVFFSSDVEPMGGMGAGNWRRELHQRMSESDCVLFLLTPAAGERPWIIYELGYARALKGDDTIYPVSYWLSSRLVPDPIADQQQFNGQDVDDVAKVVARIFGGDLPAGQVHSKDTAVSTYLAGVKKFENHLDPRLYTDRFHNFESGKKLEGTWYLRWEWGEDGMSEVYKVNVVSLPTRIRFAMTKEVDGWETAFEGVVSSRFQVALTWWAGGGKETCGTAILQRSGNGKTAIGKWTGYVALYPPHDQIEMGEGTIRMARDPGDLPAPVF